MIEYCRIGTAELASVVEHRLPLALRDLVPDFSPAAISDFLPELAPRFLDPKGWTAELVFRSWVVRTRHHTILVDTCIGNDKPRPGSRFHLTRTDYLDRLAAAGVAPEAVDFVFCTHLHIDHCGWNTRLADGRWIPTFPNARYVFSRAELHHWATLPEAERGIHHGVYEDSVLPVIAAGHAEIVEAGYRVDDEVAVEPSPGHTPGHYCVTLSQAGATAIFTGDVTHHPVQMAVPEWNSGFCGDPARAIATRRAILENAAERGTLVVPAHFTSPGLGRVERRGAGFAFITA